MPDTTGMVLEILNALLAAVVVVLGIRAFPEVTLRLQKQAVKFFLSAFCFFFVLETLEILENAGLLTNVALIREFPETGIGICLAVAIVLLHRSQKQEVNIINRQVNKDALTGLGNHVFFMRTAQRRFEKSKKHNLPTALILMDIDNFKSYNDTFGHEGGNHVLRFLGQVLSDSVRADDILARYGGEEFVVIINEEVDKANIVAERIRSNVERLCSPENTPLLKRNITLSLGIAHLNQETRSLEELIVIADNQMYRAKMNGKNCIKSDEDIIASLFFKRSKIMNSLQQSLTTTEK
jgi:diguanylate cyclase (GGDEF)-like protein